VVLQSGRRTLAGPATDLLTNAQLRASYLGED